MRCDDQQDRGHCEVHRDRENKGQRPQRRRGMAVEKRYYNPEGLGKRIIDGKLLYKHVAARMPYFGDEPPTSTTVQVSALAGPDLMVEIEVEAVIEDAPKAKAK